MPPSDDLLDTKAQYIGAFGHANWLEERTFVAREWDSRVPEPAAEDDPS